MENSPKKLIKFLLILITIISLIATIFFLTMAGVESQIVFSNLEMKIAAAVSMFLVIASFSCWIIYRDHGASVLKSTIESGESVLAPLPLHEAMIIEEIIDSKLTIANANSTFKAGIGSNFKNLGLDKSSINTKEIKIKPFELRRDAELGEIFNSFRNSLDELCITQAQIIKFCEKYPNELYKYGANLFLIKENNEYFVVFVSVSSDGLSVRVYRLGRDDVRGGSYLRRVFVPATCTLKS